ncbi:PKD domain-containing protein [Parahaliea maris]|uniref:PKD domain-containing protein n=1 Tax=Parahaliea maris TaxID=2716870 RepID=A0A5C8ZRU1_9GAMM|nr:PKD domain-containing protein [Parahaliea maris]TXS91223.1 PKD domain-containing protein [Parahaliea maris]
MPVSRHQVRCQTRRRHWLAAAGFFTAIILPLAPAVAQVGPAAKPAFPVLSFPDRSRGQRAIGRLGANLPEVAAWYGLHPAEFTRMLREDDTAWIDLRGRLLFIDERVEGGEQPLAPAAAPFPLEDTFTLHSKPGAARVLYLDFDGHQTSGTAWNLSSGVDPIISPPYSRDSDPAFSTLELEYIQDMWRQVAEDYAPFDVDVTTEDPGSAAIIRSSSGDADFGTRVVITEDNFDNCGCGGFAYVGVFDNIGSYNKPAFVFNTSLVGAGEAISHEAGHNLGLSHDGASGGVGYYEGHGSGATGWAPIMGVGYYQPLVQWSQGEYSGANNQQDDLQIIQNNGAPMVADDHGDSNAAASAMDISTDGSVATLSASGLIHRREDVDVFRFVSGSGNYSIAVDPAAFAPNLDILAALYDSSGSLVASSNPADFLEASLAGALAAGEYYLHVDGTGKGSPDTDYSDYGSLGRYSVSGTVPDASGLAPPVAVAAFSPPYSITTAPVTVGFSGEQSSDPDGNVGDLAWDWDFGDGNTGSGATTSHQYTLSGTHTVTLTVTDSDNLSDTDTLQVDIINQAPVASISADVLEGETPHTVQFDASLSNDPDGSISSYLWQFGDGAQSSEAAPTHEYQSQGVFNASLTVTDNLGASSSPDVTTVTVTLPAVYDQFATGDQPAAGTVSGSYADTRFLDTEYQSIRERESGGKKRDRYSYLEHYWTVDVNAGDTVTLVIHGYQDSSSDNDAMEIRYLTPGSSNPSTDTITLGTSPSQYSLALPAGVSGQYRIQLTDSDQSPGNNALDTAYIDQIYVRTESDGGGPDPLPLTPPVWMSLDPASDSVTLNWTGSSGADGFHIERSSPTSTWSPVPGSPFAPYITSHQDSGLEAVTTYSYRIQAYRDTEVTAWVSESATTLPGNPPPDISLNANGYKVKGLQRVDLEWSPAGEVEIYRDDVPINLDPVSGTTYTDAIDQRGGGSYRYQVCQSSAPAPICSNEAVVVF